MLPFLNLEKHWRGLYVNRIVIKQNSDKEWSCRIGVDWRENMEQRGQRDKEETLQYWNFSCSFSVSSFFPSLFFFLLKDPKWGKAILADTVRVGNCSFFLLECWVFRSSNTWSRLLGARNSAYRRKNILKVKF